MTPRFIRALRNDLVYVNNWRGFANEVDGDSVNVSYNFIATLNRQPRVNPLPDINFGMKQVNSKQAAIVKRALDVWASYVDVTFVKTDATDADIMFGLHRMHEPIEGYAGRLLFDPATDAMRPHGHLAEIRKLPVDEPWL